MNPYRTPHLGPTNSMWCVICEEHTLEACSFKHPSTIGSVNVCFKCVDSFKQSVAWELKTPVEVLERMIVIFLIFSEYNRIKLNYFIDLK